MKKWEQLSEHSDLVTDELKKQIIPLFKKLKTEVVLKAVISPEDEKCIEMASFLKAVASLSERIKLMFLEVDEDEKIQEELHAERLPATGIYDADGTYSGVCFHGIPGGKEINSFLAAVCNFGGAGQKPDRRLKKEIEKISSTAQIKIFVSLACHHCPHVVAACQKIAMASPYVSADMYDARLYPDLIEQYQIERVPMTVINDDVVIMGQKTIEEFVEYLQK